MDSLSLWRKYKDTLCTCPALGISLDISRVDFDPHLFLQNAETTASLVESMKQLEGGAIANPDEGRMVGHYWLRNPNLAPTEQITKEIEQTLTAVMSFAADVHATTIKPANAQRYTDLLVVGIGGSALGPQLVADALGSKRDKLDVHFLDNTDPDGFDRVLESLGARIKSTLVIVISKSGGTKETRNGMIECELYFARKGADFAQQAVAVTGVGSALDQYATEKKWLRRFPMWDWVGGRTSVMSAVGLLPAALQGLDIPTFLDGAAEMDKLTRSEDFRVNPAVRLAFMWRQLTNGNAEKAMVVLPYKDRLVLLSRYLQQLVMESLGKEKNLSGEVVHQGITVFGNKGSTDQHAYVQQLRDGPANFFANFIVVLQDRHLAPGASPTEVEPGVTSGDFLNGFWQGTRQALYESGRQSITITIEKLDAHSLGGLIALYERTVGYYADLVKINAYNQPGVEAGKKAAVGVLELQAKVVAFLKANAEPASAEQIADRMGLASSVESIQHTLEHMSFNKRNISHSRGKFKYKI